MVIRLLIYLILLIVNKKYVDTEVVNLTPQNSLLLDGSKAMNAYLDMGNNKITNPDTLNCHKVDDDDTILKDLKSGVNNTEYLDSNFKKKDIQV